MLQTPPPGTLLRNSRCYATGPVHPNTDRPRDRPGTGPGTGPPVATQQPLLRNGAGSRRAGSRRTGSRRWRRLQLASAQWHCRMRTARKTARKTARTPAPAYQHWNTLTQEWYSYARTNLMTETSDPKRMAAYSLVVWSGRMSGSNPPDPFCQHMWGELVCVCVARQSCRRDGVGWGVIRPWRHPARKRGTRPRRGNTPAGHRWAIRMPRT
jgi:hypothetical protein